MSLATATTPDPSKPKVGLISKQFEEIPFLKKAGGPGFPRTTSSFQKPLQNHSRLHQKHRQDGSSSRKMLPVLQEQGEWKIREGHDDYGIRLVRKDANPRNAAVNVERICDSLELIVKNPSTTAAFSGVHPCGRTSC
jgi:hypothetical protein